MRQGTSLGRAIGRAWKTAIIHSLVLTAAGCMPESGSELGASPAARERGSEAEAWAGQGAAEPLVLPEIPDQIPAQVPPPCAQAPTHLGDVLAAFDRDRMQPPGYNYPEANWREPTAAELSAARAMMLSLLAGDHAAAGTSAAAAGYRLCRDGSVILVEPLVLGEGWPTLTLRMSAAAELIIGVPHAWYELGTLDIGKELFAQLGARALVVAGAHRCASADVVTCTGTTEICGEASGYRTSDAAHASDSLFQVFHEALIDVLVDDWVINLHGMSDEGISISDGIESSTDTSGAAARVAHAMYRQLREHGDSALSTLTTCIDGLRRITHENRLCGRNNLQGRYANGSANSCTDDAPDASGRFIHVELSDPVRENHLQDLVDAFAAALPNGPLAAGGILSPDMASGSLSLDN